MHILYILFSLALLQPITKLKTTYKSFTESFTYICLFIFVRRAIRLIGYVVRFTFRAAKVKRQQWAAPML